LNSDITISDNEGNILAEVPDLPVSDTISHHQNKELFLQLSLDQQSPFPPGDYVINYVVRRYFWRELRDLKGNYNLWIGTLPLPLVMDYIIQVHVMMH
jgi:hypothetical protein